jgi:hypothetical protein
VQLAQNVFQLWSQGSQAPALEQLKPRADEDEPWAVGLMAWLHLQQGIPGFEPALTYAARAQALGQPWIAVNVFNNVVGNVQQVPNLLDRALALLTPGPLVQPGIDPTGQGWNLLSQGNPGVALRVMGIRWMWPVSTSEWEAMAQSAQRSVAEVTQAVTQARDESREVTRVAAESKAVIGKARDDLETSAKQAGLLVSKTTSDAINALFEENAKSNALGSLMAWCAGLVVLGGAATVAIYPLWQHYHDRGPVYTSSALVGAHLAATVALGTVAGVLLARARSRDQARQQSKNLSIAMGTMISYSNQIRDEDERERFMLAMGQLVLQAHLSAGSEVAAAKEESLTGIAALLSVMKDFNAPKQT